LLFLSYPTIMRSRPLCYYFQLPDDRGHGAIYFYSNYHTIAATVPLFIYFHLPYDRGNCALSFIPPPITLQSRSRSYFFSFPTTIRSWPQCYFFYPRYLPLFTHYHATTVRKFFKLNRILKSHTFTC
jgi:hypothetical protein